MKKSFAVFVLFSVLVFASCGGGSGVDSLDKLPRMTNPVITSGAASLRFNSIGINSASTGVKP